MTKNILVIDADIPLHQAAARCRQVTEWSDDVVTEHTDVTEALHHVMDYVARCVQIIGDPSAKTVLAISDQTGNRWRNLVQPDYKGNRIGRKAAGYVLLVRRLRQAHSMVIEKDRLEGDDVIGLAMTAPAGAWLPVEADQVIGVSEDKDLLGVPGWLLNPRTGDLTYRTEHEANLFHLLQAVAGDRTDGYPGCPGIGMKRGADLLDKAYEQDRDPWEAIVDAFERSGLPRHGAEQDALMNARVARILRWEEWDPESGSVLLWAPEGQEAPRV